MLGHKTQKAKAQLEIKPAIGIKEMAGYVCEERVVRYLDFSEASL